MPRLVKRRHTQFPEGWEHPPCQVCAKPIERREGETMRLWAERGCCSIRCSGKKGALPAMRESARKFMAAQAAHPPCWHCQGVVVPRRDEPLGRYTKRATCQTDACRTAYRSHVMGTEAARRRELRDSADSAPRQIVPADTVVRETDPIDFGGGFAAHNLAVKPSLGRVSRPFVGSYGVASSWAVR